MRGIIVHIEPLIKVIQGKAVMVTVPTNWKFNDRKICTLIIIIIIVYIVSSWKKKKTVLHVGGFSSTNETVALSILLEENDTPLLALKRKQTNKQKNMYRIDWVWNWCFYCCHRKVATWMAYKLIPERVGKYEL